MIFTMLFEESQIETKKKPAVENADTVHTATPLRLILFPLLFVLFLGLGILFLILKEKLIPQYLATAICLFLAALVPLFFFIDALTFRLSIGKGKIALKKFLFAEKLYDYTDVSWKLSAPDKKKSAITLYAKKKQIARIPYGAKNYALVTTLRHKGTFSDGEKELLRTLKH